LPASIGWGHPIEAGHSLATLGTTTSMIGALKRREHKLFPRRARSASVRALSKDPQVGEASVLDRRPLARLRAALAHKSHRGVSSRAAATPRMSSSKARAATGSRDPRSIIRLTATEAQSFQRGASSRAAATPRMSSSKARVASRSHQGGVWLPFLDTYRTMCLAPEPDFRRVLEDIRAMQLAA
jgi:hypothetical protein